MAYIQGNSVPRANCAVLNKLIAARHEIAQVIFLNFSIWIIIKYYML